MSNGRRSQAEARRLYRQRVRAANKRADEAFKGKYKAEIEGLYGLSRAEINAITQDTTDIRIYDRLMETVKEASRVNLAQAEFKQRIVELGEIAVSIAGKVPSLKKILA